MGFSKSGSKREIYSKIILPQGKRNISNKQLTSHIKQLHKEEFKKTPKLAEGKKS